MKPQTGQSRGFHQAVMGGLRRGKMSIGIRMTPMIDVIFLLLTFFVLTAKFREPEQILPIFIGTANAQTAQSVIEPLTIYLKPDAGGCVVETAGQANVILTTQKPQEGLLTLTETLQAIDALKTVGRPVELYCDDAVKWDWVVKVYDLLYALGARDITFRVEE